VAISPAGLEAVLDPLRQGLQSDGFDLRAGATGDERVQVILEAKEGACLDCLVPESFMIQMIEDGIRKQDGTVAQVELVKLGFEGLAEH
jgi:hypothetical protein